MGTSMIATDWHALNHLTDSTTAPWPYPSTCGLCNCVPCQCWTPPPTWPVPSVTIYPSITTTVEKPKRVKLSPAEFETLRKAADESEDVKAVLRKLADCIEVEVDFP